MRNKETLSYRFNQFKRQNVGAIIILEETIRGMKYRKQEIVDAFNKFVPKDEYARDEKDELLTWLQVRNFCGDAPKIPFINKGIEK